MAKMDISGLSSLLLDMGSLTEVMDDTADEMLKAESEVIVDAQKTMAQRMKVQDTGAMIRSIKAGKVKKLKDGKAIYVTPSGSRKRGHTTTRNAEIAFINEYGKKGQPARPFIRTANEQSADKAVDKAADIYDRFLRSRNL